MGSLTTKTAPKFKKELDQASRNQESKLDYYDPFVRARNLIENKVNITQYTTIEKANLVNKGNQSMGRLYPSGENLTKLQFQITTGTLSITTSDGKTYSIKATSGRGQCMNKASAECQKASFEGAIPIGKYYISPSELDDPSWLWDRARREIMGDWGDWRVVLHPSPGTETHGRDNFFLHGGDTLGSAGCIDIGGRVSGNALTNRLKRDIKASKVSIELVVSK